MAIRDGVFDEVDDFDGRLGPGLENVGGSGIERRAVLTGLRRR
jgi:hypothetical protein